jgi:glycosyltransferase involved in cell wall biosynthesis
MPSGRLRTLLDAQAFQNPWSAERGIGRYVRELLAAFDETGEPLRPSLVLNPDLPVPRLVQPHAGRARVTFSDRLSPEDGDIFHVPSPFEPASIDRVWPPATRGLPLVVTVHDLIPFVVKDLYLRDAKERRWFRTRLELLRRAERVIAVSRSTADDVVEHVGIARERVVVTSEGPAASFRPPNDRGVGLQELQQRLPSIRPEFVVYQGGMDARKNIPRLVEAYGGLPQRLRRRHQLVVVCAVTAAEQKKLGRLLDRFGVTGEVLFPGYVPDDVLLLLYQSAKLAVFPSLYEGFGLPVAEAMACGTPVIGSGASSIPELIENEEALFDPYDVDSIRAALRRALEDEPFLAQLGQARLDKRHSWHEAAKRTAEVYRSASGGRRERPRSRPRLAVGIGLPPHDPDRSRETYRLLACLARRCEVDAFFGDRWAACPPHAVNLQSLSFFDLAERGRGGYDALFWILDDDRASTPVLSVARARGGRVLLRTPALTRLYSWWARERTDIVPGGFAQALRRIYGNRFPLQLSESRRISRNDAERHGLLMAREVVAAAEKVIVHSAYARQLLELDAGAADAGKIMVVPPVFPAARRYGAERAQLVVARVGQDGAALPTAVEALTLLAAERPELRLGIVISDRGRRLRAAVRERVEAEGLRSRVTLVSERERGVWRRWLEEAAAGVQLLDAPEPVVAGFVAEAFAAGVPTVLSDLGPLGELPSGSAVKLPAGSSPEAVADAIRTLLDGGAEVADAAATYAEANGVEQLAERLLRSIFS